MKFLSNNFCFENYYFNYTDVHHLVIVNISEYII